MLTPETILYIITGIICVQFVLDTTLDVLNYKALSSAIPDALKDIYTKDEHQKSIAYNRENYRLGFITSIIGFVVTLAVLLSGFLGEIDAFLRTLVPFDDNPIFFSLFYFGVIYIAYDLLSIPVQWYATFDIEEKYGFNKMTPKTFVVDKLKGYLLTIVMGGVLLGALLYLVIMIGEDFWIWFWLFISLFMIFMNMFYASLIVPLFNKLTPLEDGELRNAIEVYSKKAGFPLTNIYVIDGSKRSSKANAFFSGFGKNKKIVLYDTLIEKHSTEELVAVLAHEVGHFKEKHILSTMALSIIQTGLMLYILSWFIFNPQLPQALGMEVLPYPTAGIHLSLIAFSLLYAPVSEILGLLMNIKSRKNEYEADYFAATTYDAKPLITALKKLSAHNYSQLTPHKAYAWFHFSHPPMYKRLNHLESIKK